ncbi:MAG: APC family permease, partial [Bacillota bacterium]
LAAGLTLAELAAVIPRDGGLSIYLNEIYGHFWAFLLGWVDTMIYTPGSAAALAIILVTQFSVLYPASILTQKALALVIIFLLVWINTIGTKQGGFIQTSATIAKLIPIALLVIWGVTYHGPTAVSQTPVAASQGTSMGAAILATLWAYDGWNSVTNIAGEIKDPGRLLPRSIIFGIGLVMVVYLLLNVALLLVIPAQLLAQSETPATDVASVLFGSVGARFISISILISIFGSLNGYIMTGPRVPYALGQRRLLPLGERLEKLHPRFETPANAILLVGVLSSIYTLFGNFNLLTDLIVFVYWIFFVMCLVGVFIHRRRYPELQRPYRVPLYPLIPLIGIGGGLYILISTLLEKPRDALLAIGLTMLGVPVYWWLRRRYR